MTPTSTLPVPVLPLLPSGDELFDAVMASIEPDLLSENREKTALKILNATPAERTAMAKRYQKAFETYDAQLVLALKEWNQRLHGARRDMMHMIESMTQSEETNELDALESQISSIS